MAHARHAAPAADRDAAADPRDHRAAHHAARGHAPSATRTRRRGVHRGPRARRSARSPAAPRSRATSSSRRGSRRASEPTAQRGYHLIWWLAHDARALLRPGRGSRAALRAARRVGAVDRPGPRPRRDAREPARRLRRRPRPGHGARLRLVDADSRSPTRARRSPQRATRVVAFDDEHVVAADAGWAADPASTTPRTTRRLALAAFDEYFLGYTDRGDVCDPRHAPSGRARPERGVPADPRERRRRRRGRLEGHAGPKGAASVALDGVRAADRPVRVRAPPSRGGRGSTANELGPITAGRRDPATGRREYGTGGAASRHRPFRWRRVTTARARPAARG